MTESPHVTIRSSCAHCGCALEIECKGFVGFWGYDTYNEYFCPCCRKQNHAHSTGAVVSVRALTEPVPTR
jgi:hypothetical protein